MAPKVTDVTVYIGRFNPFHKGHAHVLQQALETSKLVIVLVGSSGQSRSLKNPFSFDERREMIERWQVESGIGFEAHPTNNGLSKLVILPIRDYPYNDALWMRQVQSAVKKATKKFAIERGLILTDVSITGSDRDETTWYLNSFPQWKQKLVEPFRVDVSLNVSLNVSATDVRAWLFATPFVGHSKADRIQETLPNTTRRFLHEFQIDHKEAYKALCDEYSFVQKYKAAWSVAPYPVTFVTVDAVVVQSGHVLIVKRGHQPGKGLWALPGGFVNQGERLRDAAIRELSEETGIRLAMGKNAKEITKAILKGSIVEHEVFDHPGRSSRGRTITTAYLFRLDDTKPLPPITAGSEDADAPDEITDAKWIPINEALERTDMWFEDHLSILETLVGTKDL